MPLGAFIAATSTWRLAFVIGAALGVVAFVLQLMTLPAIPSQGKVRPAALTALFAVPRARIGFVIGALLFAAQFAAYTFISPFLERTANISPDTVSIALFVFGVSGIVGNFVAGAALHRSLTATLVASGLLLAAAVAVLPIVAHLPVAVFALLVVWGLVWGGIPLSTQTWIVTSAPKEAQAGLALFISTIQIALAIGSVLGGIVVTASGMTVDFQLASVLALLGTAVVLLFGIRASQAQFARA